MPDAHAPSDLPLVLLPGTLCDERVFGPLAERIIGREVLIGDMTGARTAPAQAERLLAHLPEQFALAGFSLGGIVALEMIAQAPHRIERLALLGTTARADQRSNAALRRRAVDRAQTAGIASYIDDAWPGPVSPANADRKDLRAQLIAMAERAGVRVLDSQSEVAINRVDSRPRLKQIAVPTLVVCGADDSVCRLDIHREIAALIPHAELAVIPGAGHFALLENPDAVANHVRTWLALPSTRMPHARAALQEDL